MGQSVSQLTFFGNAISTMSVPSYLQYRLLMSLDTIINLYPETDDDATQWQNDEDRQRLIAPELDDDDTTLVDTTLGVVITGPRMHGF